MMFSNSDRIAVCGEFVPTSLKQRLLFFDRIGIFEPMAMKLYSKMTQDMEGFGSDHPFSSVADDLEFLEAKNIAFDATPLVPDYPNGRDDAPPEDLADFELATAIAREQYGSLEDGRVGISQEERQLQARMCVRHMRRIYGLEVSALTARPLGSLEALKDLPESERESANVINVVLEKLPLPSEQTPWEAILDFKADDEAQGYLQGLKVWMGDLARQKLSAREADEKLEWLLFQNRKHLEMHKLSYRWGTLGGTFVATTEILEDLVKFKWGKAAGAAVSLVDKRLELMKAELSNPAKEVSYIVKAQGQFGK